jgi:hypothetical protein
MFKYKNVFTAYFAALFFRNSQYADCERLILRIAYSLRDFIETLLAAYLLSKINFEMVA